jgi:hypothetical protein
MKTSPGKPRLKLIEEAFEEVDPEMWATGTKD